MRDDNLCPFCDPDAEFRVVIVGGDHWGACDQHMTRWIICFEICRSEKDAAFLATYAECDLRYYNRPDPLDEIEPEHKEGAE